MPEDSSLQQINQKLDMFITYYKDRHEDLEERVNKIEQRVEIVDSKLNNLHNSSMQWVNDAMAKQTEKFTQSVQEVERRISDKIDEKSKFSISQWVIIASALITVAGAILVAILK